MTPPCESENRSIEEVHSEQIDDVNLDVRSDNIEPVSYHTLTFINIFCNLGIN